MVLQHSIRVETVFHICYRYDEEAMFFDAEVRMVKREELVEKVYGLVKPAFEEQVSHLVEKTSSTFDRNVQVGITVEKKEFTECTSECRSQALKEFGENFASIVVKDTGWLQPLYQPRLEAILDKHIDQLTNEKVWCYDFSYPQLSSSHLMACIVMDKGSMFPCRSA